MLFNLIAYSLPPIVAAFLLCRWLTKRYHKISETHLSKLAIYELFWALYWVGWCFTDTATQGHPPGILIFIGMLFLGFIVMPIYGVAYGLKLHITKSFSKVRDWILFAINLFLLLGTYFYYVYKNYSII